MNKNKILLVDNSDYRELLALLLRRSGYVVVEAATGLDALDQTHELKSKRVEIENRWRTLS